MADDEDEEREEATRRLATVTGAELAAEVRTAVAEVLAAFDAGRADPAWHRRRRGGPEDKLARVVDAVGKDLAGLPAEAELRRVIAAVRSTLNGYWPTWSVPTAGVRRFQTLIVGRGVIGIGAFA